MPDTINIAGKPVNKYAVYAVGGTVVLGGIMYYRKQSAAKTANANAITAAGSTETDPATGYPYGSPEDEAALAAQGQSVAGSLGDGVGGSYGFVGGSSSGIFGTEAPGAFTTNADWAQYVEAYEVNNMGADAPTVGNAIGKYLTGQPITTDAMVSIIQSAIAIGGYPPVAGTNGDPPNYITSGNPTTPPPTGNQPPPVVTPPPTNTSPPMSQTGTVTSKTTGRSGQVNTTNGGKTWNYIGVKSHEPEPNNQTGTVHSATTGGSANVKTTDGGLHWQYVG